MRQWIVFVDHTRILGGTSRLDTQRQSTSMFSILLQCLGVSNGNELGVMIWWYWKQWEREEHFMNVFLSHFIIWVINLMFIASKRLKLFHFTWRVENENRDDYVMFWGDVENFVFSVFICNEIVNLKIDSLLSLNRSPFTFISHTSHIVISSSPNRIFGFCFNS